MFLNLSNPSNITVENELFTAIRRTADITTNFNYTNTPVDPVTVGIINSQRVGIGHKAQLINNQANPGPAQWRQVLGEPEPNIGAGSLSYYTGQELWPCISTSSPITGLEVITYQPEGAICNFKGTQTPTYTEISPTGISNSTCVSYASSITAAENNLQIIIDRNVPQIATLIYAAATLRASRDSNEAKAWSYLQSASYLRSEINNTQSNINSLNNFDYNSL